MTFQIAWSHELSADDIYVTVSASNVTNVEALIKTKLKDTDLWLKTRKLRLDVTKTELMIARSR